MGLPPFHHLELAIGYSLRVALPLHAWLNGIRQLDGMLTGFVEICSVNLCNLEMGYNSLSRRRPRQGQWVLSIAASKKPSVCAGVFGVESKRLG